MELNIIDSKNPLNVSDDVFGREYKQDLIHQVVNAFRAAGRSGTKAQKSRSDMSGTTKKFKKQKGGGARHGDYRAPIFVGGGRASAARPRSFEQKINRKMYRGAIASILSELARTGRLKVVESFDIDAPKTKQLYAKIESLGGGKTLIVTEAGSQNLFLAAQNLPYVGVVDVAGLNPVDLVYADNVVMTVETVKKVEEWLA